VAIAPGMFLAHKVVPSSGSTADIDFRPGLASDLLADEQHRRLVALALADHHGAVDRQLVELAPHRVDRRLIGRLLVAAAAQARRRHAARSVTRTISSERTRSSIWWPGR
jgi:hypothetical protein